MTRILSFRLTRHLDCHDVSIRPARVRSVRTAAATRGLIRIGIVFLLSCSVFLPCAVTASPALMCDAAARLAAAQLDLPPSILRSITRTETGRARGDKLEPWPWTVNMEGKGHWFETESAAKAFVEKELRRGARSFDVGCFQINYKWHGHAFRSIDQMFDPTENALYAATYLADLFAESGDWSKAAGAYHSRTPQNAEKYRARFDRIRQSLNEQPGPLAELANLRAPLPQRDKPNGFPFLHQSDAKRSNGSLVPLDRLSRGALISLGSTMNGS